MDFIKINGVALPTPSDFSCDEEDLDNDSGRSVVTGSIHRNVVSYKGVKASFGGNAITEEDANTILNSVKQANDVRLEVFNTKNGDKRIDVVGYVSKVHYDYVQIGSDSNGARWNVSFNFIEGTRGR